MFIRNSVLAAFVMLPAIALAAEPHQHGMPGMEGGMATANEEAMKAFAAANEKMMRDMHGIPMSGDADRDFVTMMIPHHQGAIDMAEIVLKYGKDPQVKALAEAIVKAQDKEIADMKDWLAKH